MRDIFNDYKRRHSQKTFAIVTASFVFALSLNAFLFGTDTGARLQTSVLNSAGKVEKVANPDLKFVSAGTGTDMLKIEIGNRMEDVVKIEIPVAFDPNGLELTNIFSEDKDAEVVNSANLPGNSIIYINFKKPKNIWEGTPILTFIYKKTATTKTVLNIGEASFIAKDGVRRYLTNTPLEF